MSAGKGDRNRTSDLNAYRSSPLWDNLGITKNKNIQSCKETNFFKENFDHSSLIVIKDECDSSISDNEISHHLKTNP